MKLYHFCAAHMMPKIMNQGLTLGVYPLIGEPVEYWPKMQWLTQEPDPRKQSWATQSLVSYSRLAYRLTIQIPDNYRKKLVKASDYVKCLPERHREAVTEWEGSGSWYVYLGKIPASWIIGCHPMKEGK